MRQELFGIPIDGLTFEETVNRAVAAMKHRSPVQHVAINVAKLVKARRDAELHRDIAQSDIIGVDGAGILLAARLLGLTVPERVAGVDLMQSLLGICAKRGFRPYFLGARQDALERAMAVARGRWPGLQIAGARNGYYRREQEAEIVAAIRDSGADCLFIALPTPQKERFLHAYREVLGVPFIMGVGGSIDILACQIERAPLAFQRLGLEWLYRIYQEPGRMWWRYASTNAVFAGLLAQALIRRALPAAPRAVSNKETSR
jgi:N-acetylglucosaminyldiphosphoundecaprenol N-acetyl-beta-D-mannosaminyltransferase